MSKKSLLMVAAAVVSVAVMSSAQGAVADSRFETAPIVRELGVFVHGFRLDEGVDSVAREIEGERSAIVEAGLWSSVKSAAKTVASGVKSAATKAAKKVGSAVKNTVTNPIGTLNKIGDKVKDVAKGIGRRAWNAPIVTDARKIAGKVVDPVKKGVQKIMTPVGKKIAKVVS